MDAEALAGFVMPLRTSALNSLEYFSVLNVYALAAISKPAWPSASIRVSLLMNTKAMSGFPQSPA